MIVLAERRAQAGRGEKVLQNLVFPPFVGHFASKLRVTGWKRNREN